MASIDIDLDELGRRVESIVDRAINSQDYQQLNQTIRQMVTRVVDVGGEAVRRVVDTANEAERNVQRQQQQTLIAKQLYGKTGGKTVAGVLKTVIGGELSVVGLALVIISLVMETTVGGHLVSTLLSGLLLGSSLWLTGSGVKLLGMVKRFRVYRNALGTKTHCSVKRLAGCVGKDEAFVRKDLWKMIGKGFFLEGHLDKEEKTLITSNETFKHYEQSRLAYEQRKRLAEATQTKQEAKPADGRNQDIQGRGEQFLAQIRHCNDRIPGEEISRKISRIELLVQRIFQRAQSHPEIIPDLKKMMDYYLPMTIKLLNAYADMDAQPVQGQTIQASKREIEDTLDTLTLAFEKLLDSIFQDTALDVSSDISVLNTLLAQEGLKEDELTKMRNRNEEQFPS